MVLSDRQLQSLLSTPPSDFTGDEAVMLSLSSGLTNMGVRGNVFRLIEWPHAFWQLGSRLGTKIDSVRIKNVDLDAKVVSVELVKLPATSLDLLALTQILILQSGLLWFKGEAGSFARLFSFSLTFCP